MNVHISDDNDNTDENLMTVNLDDDVTDDETSQPAANEKYFNISARRRIEEYMENKHLASLTADYFFAD